jgi:hypothetical protein
MGILIAWKHSEMSLESKKGRLQEREKGKGSGI